MAAPPRIRGISRESLPGAPAWVDPLLQLLNEGMGQTANALARGLTFQDNHVAQLKEFSFTAPAPVWIAPTFANGWVNYSTVDATAGYRIEGGRVHLKGLIKSGTVTAAGFTLPVGFRPVERTLFSTTSNDAFGGGYIQTTGEVVPQVGSNVFFALSQISFDAATPCAFPSIPTGWPKFVSHTLPYVAGVVPVSCRCLENVGSGTAGAPSIDWERANEKSIRIRNVFGLTPGRKYTMTLLLFAG